MTPTSFVINLKQITETWEVNRSADIRSWQNWYRMKKKIIVPSVLGILVLIFIVSKIIGGGKIVLDWESSNSSPTLPDTVCLNVYVENSGSMNGYMCNGSNLKDAVYDYVSDLKKNTTTCDLFYINSQIIPCKESLDNYIKNLTPSSFAKAGGNLKDTDLRSIFKLIMNKHETNTVSVFVSDCILDIPQSATDFFGNCQVSIKNTFNEAIAKYPDLGVEIVKLQSKFDGYWFCGKNKQLLNGVKRPYYIWVIGDKNILAMLNEKVPVAKIIGGIDDYCAYATSQPISFNIDQKKFAVNHANKINVEVLVDLRPSLQEESLLENIYQYTPENPVQTKVVSVRPISKSGSKYSHVIKLELSSPQTLKTTSFTLNYPEMAQWVRLSNDSTGNYNNSIDKTTGIQYLIQGVADAYRDHLNFGTITFNLKNK